MADIVDKKTRSRMMSGIKGKNTKPEIKIRKALFAKGFRYRLHAKKLPGKPDLVFPKHRAAIFVHGCFWHGHGCSLFKWPTSNEVFWEKKITGNKNKDVLNVENLEELGWRVLIVWECAVRGPHKLGLEIAVERISQWITSESSSLEIRERLPSD